MTWSCGRQIAVHLISSVEIANQAEPESGDLGVTFVNYPTGAAAEIAPRSGRLATLGGDNTAIIWDAAWQKPALVLSGHTKGVNSVDWSPDETKLATASLDGTARVWDAQTGQALFTLDRPSRAGQPGAVVAGWRLPGNGRRGWHAAHLERGGRRAAAQHRNQCRGGVHPSMGAEQRADRQRAWGWQPAHLGGRQRQAVGDLARAPGHGLRPEMVAGGRPPGQRGWQRQCTGVECRAQHRLAFVPAPGGAGRGLDGGGRQLVQ